MKAPRCPVRLRTEAFRRGLRLAVACSARLDGDRNPLPQELWRKVCAVVPREGVVRNRKALEELNVTEHPKNRAFQFIVKIHFTNGTVTEPEPYAVVSNVARLKNV